jgi:DNA-binding MarR family transcriptional regulator
MVIMLELYQAGALEFVQLQRDLDIGDGALATHIKALLKARLIVRQKEEVDGRSRTVYLITGDGMEMIRRLFKTLSDEERRVAIG